MQKQDCRLVMAQLNPLVGDIDGNKNLVSEAIKHARMVHRANIIVFSELVISGYPPEDLLYRSGFISRCERAVKEIASYCQNITAVIGMPVYVGNKIRNAAVVIRDTRKIGMAYKQCLPNYGVFDENRYFSAGNETLVIELLPGIRGGITICEDVWSPRPVAEAAAGNADIIININASPFHEGKYAQRLEVLNARVSECRVPLIYVNQVGGQDELVFDGGSMAIDGSGKVCARSEIFNESGQLVSIRQTDAGLVLGGRIESIPEGDELIYDALVYGVSEYVGKNGFSGVVLGLSGGIDSALTLAIAVDALGADKVSAVMMPYLYTSDMSLEDAEEEAANLGVDYSVIPIEPIFNEFGCALGKVFHGEDRDVTEENIQARIRGVMLMAISNKKGKLLLTTGNKSEMAVGYATLYGDMAGGYAPLKDVYKTSVYRLAKYRNSISNVIPRRVMDRAPSAELAPDQTDRDTLPEYEILDDILKRYIEDHESVSSIIGSGHQTEQVQDIVQRVDINEYKRRQAPPGIKITDRAFGRDWRFPMTYFKGL